MENYKENSILHPSAKLRFVEIYFEPFGQIQYTETFAFFCDLHSTPLPVNAGFILTNEVIKSMLQDSHLNKGQ